MDNDEEDLEGEEEFNNLVEFLLSDEVFPDTVYRIIPIDQADAEMLAELAKPFEPKTIHPEALDWATSEVLGPPQTEVRDNPDYPWFAESVSRTETYYQLAANQLPPDGTVDRSLSHELAAAMERGRRSAVAAMLLLGDLRFHNPEEQVVQDIVAARQRGRDAAFRIIAMAAERSAE